MPGVVWAALSGIAFGFSQLSNRGVNQQTDALKATTAMVTAMLVALAAATAITGNLADIASMPGSAFAWFTAASVIHFLLGWTLFAVSQQRIGPSRTAAVLSINPVVAALVAAVVISQDLRVVTWVGVVAVTVGVGVVATRGREGQHLAPKRLLPILSATLMFSLSPLFVTFGLADFDQPLVGLLVGIAVTTPLMHLSTRIITGGWVRIERPMWHWLALGGVTAGFAVVAQWTAFDLIPVGATVSLQQVSTPVVLFVGPALLSAPRERPTARMLIGTGLILLGAILVALYGRELT